MVNRKIRCIRYFVLLSLIVNSSLIFSQSKWQFIESPSSETTSSLILLGERLFLAGDKIFELIDGKFIPFKNQPPVAMREIFMLAPDKIWAANVTENSDSELYFFNGKSWRRIYNPLANNITSILFFDENNGYIGGLGELVEVKDGKYTFLDCPVVNTIRELFRMDDSVLYIRSTSGELYYYKNGNWIRELSGEYILDVARDKRGNYFAIAKNKVFQFKSGKWILHSESPDLLMINKLCAVGEQHLWAVGYSGKILEYSGGKWQQIKSPRVSESLLDILMLGNGEGYLTGTNGMLLRYSSQTLPALKSKLSFTRLHLFNGSKRVDDEYGVSINDFNNDGLPDIYTVGIFEPDRLYINYGDRYRDESQDRDIASSKRYEDVSNTLLNLGVAAGDIDNDGDLDIFVSSLNGYNKLFVNHDGGYFYDFSKEAGVEGLDFERTNAGIFADFDNDGDLDLFITNENSTNRLFLNNGAGYFKDVTESAGINSDGGSTGAIAGDYDGDNDIDIYVCNWSRQNLLYRNDSDASGIKFTEVAKEAGVAGLSYAKSNGAVFADFDNDGDLDLYVTNRKQSNRLYLNHGANFTDVTESYIGVDSMKSYGVVSADFNHDGWTDLFVSNIGSNKFYEGTGSGHFREIGDLSPGDLTGYSTGSSAADADNDGDIDIYVANYVGDSGHLLRNNLNDNKFISISFDCTVSNKFGFGVKAWLYKVINGKNELAGFRENNTFEGYASQGLPRLNFTADENSSYDLVVYFPASKITKTIKNVRAGSVLTISEENGFEVILSRSAKILAFLYADRRFHVELYKALFLLILLVIWLRLTVDNRKFVRNPAMVPVLVVGIYFALTYFFYRESFILAHIVPIVITSLQLTGFYFYFERKKAAEERRLIRIKIARDLHDDLASNLSAVSLYTGSLKDSGNTDAAVRNSILSKLERLVTEAQESLTEIVWSVTPQNDMLDSLFGKIRNYAVNILSPAGIEVKFEIPEDLENRNISHELRRNVFLIFKEALSNIIKYSSAKSVYIIIRGMDSGFRLIVRDDGKGLPGGKLSLGPAELSERCVTVEGRGNGMKNMASRANEIGANIKIDSEPGKGVCIELSCKMMHMHY